MNVALRVTTSARAVSAVADRSNPTQRVGNPGGPPSTARGCARVPACRLSWPRGECYGSFAWPGCRIWRLTLDSGSHGQRESKVRDASHVKVGKRQLARRFVLFVFLPVLAYRPGAEWLGNITDPLPVGHRGPATHVSSGTTGDTCRICLPRTGTGHELAQAVLTSANNRPPKPDTRVLAVSTLNTGGTAHHAVVRLPALFSPPPRNLYVRYKRLLI